MRSTVLCPAAMMRFLVLAMWAGSAYVLYRGLAARLLPHQPRWQAAAMVLVIFGLFFGGVAVFHWASQRPNYGVEDGGETYRTGRPESL